MDYVKPQGVTERMLQGGVYESQLSSRQQVLRGMLAGPTSASARAWPPP